MSPEPGVDIAALRREYADAGLTESALAADPFAMFDRWFDEAQAAGLHEPNAMVVSTVSADGRPVVPAGAAQGRVAGGLRVLHEPRRRARASSSPPTPTARCCSRGTRWSGRCGSRARRRRCRARTSPPTSSRRPRGVAARRPRVPPVATGGRPGRARGGVRRAERAVRRPRRPGARGVGRLPGGGRGRSSSGRGGRAGCTTGSSTRGPRRRGPWAGSLLDLDGNSL